MKPQPDTAASEVLAVFDDEAASALVLEWSGMLARVTGRDLAVVYVESTVALRAAALPITQVLSHAGAAWAPFGPDDLERGYRIQAARLRARAEQVAHRHAVRCSLRTARGAAAQAALTLAGDATMVVLGAARPRLPGPSPLMPRVVLLFDAVKPDAQLRSLAQDLARGMGGTCAERRVDADDLCAVLAGVQADLVVLPRHLVDPAAMAITRQPLLIVGAADSAANARRGTPPGKTDA